MALYSNPPDSVWLCWSWLGPAVLSECPHTAIGEETLTGGQSDLPLHPEPLPRGAGRRRKISWRKSRESLPCIFSSVHPCHSRCSCAIFSRRRNGGQRQSWCVFLLRCGSCRFWHSGREVAEKGGRPPLSLSALRLSGRNLPSHREPQAGTLSNFSLVLRH